MGVCEGSRPGYSLGLSFMEPLRNGYVALEFFPLCSEIRKIPFVFPLMLIIYRDH
jgi:hypothetical protein